MWVVVSHCGIDGSGEDAGGSLGAEMEKGSGSGGAASANFSQLCYFFNFVFTWVSKGFCLFWCIFWHFANFCTILSLFCTFFVC